MKKTVSLLLTVLLLLGAVGSALLTSTVMAADTALAEDFNSLTTADIELYNGNNSILTNGITQHPEKWFAVDTWASDQNWGAPSIENGALNISRKTRFTKKIGNSGFAAKDDAYIVTFKAKNSGAAHTLYFCLTTVGDAGQAYSSRTGVSIVQSSEYKDYTVAIELKGTYPQNESFVFSVYNPQTAAGTVLVDNIFVEKRVPKQHVQSGLLLDGDFEYYFPGNMSDKTTTERLWGGPGSNFVKEADGNMCLFLGARAMQYVPELKSNTTYILTYYAKKNQEVVTSEDINWANFYVGISKVGENKPTWLNTSGYRANLPEEYTKYTSLLTTPNLEAGEKYALVLCSPASDGRLLLDNITLEEKPYIEPSKNGLLLDGDFSAELEGKMPEIETNEAKTTQIWAGSKTVKDPDDETNLCAVFGYDLAQYVPQLKGETTYFLTYKYKNNPKTTGTNTNFRVSVTEVGSRNAIGEVIGDWYISSSDNEWKLVKREFTTPRLEAGKKYALRLSAPATGDNVLLDDIGLYEFSAYSVDVRSYRGGTAKVNTPYANNGDKVTFTAIADENCEFKGWLKDGNAAKAFASTNPVYSPTVTENLKMVAVFQQKGQNVSSDEFLNAGAENGNLSYWQPCYSSTENYKFEIDSTEKHSGKNSFKLSATEIGIYRVQTLRGILLRPNCEYTLSAWVKTEESKIRIGFFDGEDLTPYREGTNDFVFVDRNLHPDITVTHTVGTNFSTNTRYSSYGFTRLNTKYYTGVDDKGWVQVTSTFTTSAADSGNVLNYTIGIQEEQGTIWFDDLSVTYKELDLSTRAAEDPFCEWSNNRLKNGDFEKGLAATNLNAPQSWQIVKDGTAPERTAYLKIPANSGVYVKEITVTNMKWSVLAYYLKTNKSGSSYIGLTDKAPVQNADFANPQSLGIYASKPTTSWQRAGWQMYANNVTKMWVVIYSGSNDLYLDQLQFFYGDLGVKTDLNDYDLTDPYDYEGDGVLYDSLDVEYKQLMQQTFGAGSGAPVDYDSNTAATGDAKPVLPVVFILLSCAAVCALALRKGKVTNEK